MPWLMAEDEKAVRRVGPSSVRSLEISGFRGSVPALNAAIGRAAQQLQKYVFDCPIDEEDWSAMLPPLSQAIDLRELSVLVSCRDICAKAHDSAIWSWTQPMVVPTMLLAVPAVAASLRKMTLSAQDVSAESIRALPKTLQSLVIATHTEYAPVDQLEMVNSLLAAPALHSLRTVHLYNPLMQTLDSTEGQSPIGPVWEPILKKGIAVTITGDPDHLH
jgi:hypothetical protein